MLVGWDKSDSVSYHLYEVNHDICICLKHKAVQIVWIGLNIILFVWIIYSNVLLFTDRQTTYRLQRWAIHPSGFAKQKLRVRKLLMKKPVSPMIVAASKLLDTSAFPSSQFPVRHHPTRITIRSTSTCSISTPVFSWSTCWKRWGRLGPRLCRVLNQMIRDRPGIQHRTAGNWWLCFPFTIILFQDSQKGDPGL